MRHAIGRLGFRPFRRPRFAAPSQTSPVGLGGRGPAHSLRADLHAHSSASDGPAAAALGMIGCPECYSEPEAVYDQAMARGMDLVTLTDHDTIAGALALAERGFKGVIIGEEVTVRFPEDRCKLHVLVWGLSPRQHEEIASLRLREDVYAFAAWLREQNLAHALAHPLYVQNGKLSRWHIERCTLLFKCFETLNGAHAPAHRGVLERYLASLTPGLVLKMIDRHGIQPLWPRIWEKGRTGGSDDHGLLNIGRTWTKVELGPDGAGPEGRAFLRAVMSGRGLPEGSAGSSVLLAHQLTSVGARYLFNKAGDALRPRGRAAAAGLLTLAGAQIEKPGRARLALDVAFAKLGRRRGGVLPVLRALQETISPVLGRHPAIRDRLDPAATSLGPAMSAHEEMADFAEDLAATLAKAMSDGALSALKSGDRAGIVDHVVSYAMVLAAQLPYIVSLFHQNKERGFLERFDCQTAAQTGREMPGRPMRVCLFTDTLGDVNGVSRFIQNVAEQARLSGRELRVLTSTNFKVPEHENIVNFEPIFAGKMPKYENLEFVLPPLVKMLRYVDQVRPDVVHISTPGPVGAVGWLAAKMLRAPVLGVYHTDFPAYIDHLFDDAAFTWMTTRYMKLFYGPFSSIFSRSRDYARSLEAMGFAPQRLVSLRPGIDNDLFHVRHQDRSIWGRMGVPSEGVKVLSVGRVSVEKNLPLLTKVWKQVRARAVAEGLNAQLIVVGDGPYRATMEEELAGQGAHFLGFRHGVELSAIYSSADMFVFPSTTDTLGQVVMEAQSSGLPVLVSDQGGPKEVVEEGRTGFVLAADRPEAWVEGVLGLVRDGERRRAMGAAAHRAMRSASIRASFEHYWSVHEEAWRGAGGGGKVRLAEVERAEPVATGAQR